MFLLFTVRHISDILGGLHFPASTFRFCFPSPFPFLFLSLPIFLHKTRRDRIYRPTVRALPNVMLYQGGTTVREWALIIMFCLCPSQDSLGPLEDKTAREVFFLFLFFLLTGSVARTASERSGGWSRSVFSFFFGSECVLCIYVAM